MGKKLAIFWFRRDLRLDDNAGLYHALRNGSPVLPLFIFDRVILDQLENKADRRVEFIHMALGDMQEDLKQRGSTLEIYYGFPLDIFRQLMVEYEITGVFTNTDYEPYATQRDEDVKKLLTGKGIPFYSYKDQVIFEKGEVLKEDGKPYTIFTPYSRRWRATLNDFYLSSYPVKKYWSHFLQQRPRAIPSLASLGFKKTGGVFPADSVGDGLIRAYDKQRDYPGISGTSRMGVHLRFGTVSIRALARKAVELNDTYLNELIWREFYQMILWHFPAVGKGRSFKPAYDNIQWRNNEQEFEKWCAG
ncbi:MAG TPA: deoxyribodipyrimidine photo-lyase, partial [Puia sp.]|nr:deoxyribodipyrimidine photo-lyase [Puia sp.]